MNEDIKARASVNAIGNGALPGSIGNAGYSTGLNASHGSDMSLDATNSMGSFSDEETGSTEKFERYEESYDFVASKSGSGEQFNGSMGSAKS